MTLAAALGLGDRELVAFVGAGGKSTLLFRLGEELASTGRRVVLTTTTKMGSQQARRVRVVAPDAIDPDGGLAMVVAVDDGYKVTGPAPEQLDRLFASGDVEYLLVEADGARGKSFKTPAAHEPVIPAASTIVVIVMGIDAVGHPIAIHCHRPELVARVAGCNVADVLDIDRAVRVLTHPDGFLASIPTSARLTVAVTKVDAAHRGIAEHLAEALATSRPPLPIVLVPATGTLTAPTSRPQDGGGDTPL